MTSSSSEQIAGDLLPARNERERAEHMIATGFLAIGSKTHNMPNRQQFVLDLADEQIDAASQAFLGLTIACARCHDHKFDPISQRDYYALSGIFQSTQTCYGTLPGLVQNINPSPLIELPADAGEPSAMPKLTRRAPGGAGGAAGRAGQGPRCAHCRRHRHTQGLPDAHAGWRSCGSVWRRISPTVRRGPTRWESASGSSRSRQPALYPWRARPARRTGPHEASSRCSSPGTPARSQRGAAGASWPSSWPHATTP